MKLLDWTVSYMSTEKLYHRHKQNQGAGRAKPIKVKPFHGSQSQLVNLMAGKYMHIFLPLRLSAPNVPLLFSQQTESRFCMLT